ncbi:hypothetical protein JJJ17_01695 [Paracoccus caeni]|uniref:Uncharacterized protein n=1 Tax=Paracoccus caeni TaxID=657651 RepID=A0A934SHM6_9RHOB|nr:hypothetical protein [Paracoccus caeni]MBK4214633.1 hypothetical protein [Paracoccus caeni]
MKKALGGLWLLSVAGLALALTLLTAGLRQEILHCVAQSGLLNMTPEAALFRYPAPDLASVLAGMEWRDLAVFLLSLLPFALLALRTWGRRQWVIAMGTVAFAAVVAWNLRREAAGGCSIADRIEVLPYIAPALICAMLAWRFGETFAERAGE